MAERFRELERLLLRMAELTAPTDPRRAALLRQAVAQSKQRDIDHQFEQLVELLRQERLAVVVKNQGEVQQDLAKLLELLLSEDRTKRIESEKERIREYLKRVNKIIKEQKGIQGETARGGDPRKLADRQSDLSDKTGELSKDLDQDGAKKSPADEAGKDDDDTKISPARTTKTNLKETTSRRKTASPTPADKDVRRQEIPVTPPAATATRDKSNDQGDANDQDKKDKDKKDKDPEKKDNDKRDADQKDKDSKDKDDPDKKDADKRRQPQDGQPNPAMPSRATRKPSERRPPPSDTARRKNGSTRPSNA